MADQKRNSAPRITNRRALHDYFIMSKLECGIALLGSEVKSLRDGHCQLQESFAKVEGRQLILHGCHIDPYAKAGKYNHDPLRDRVLLVHAREMDKLDGETKIRGVTLIPLAIYFKDGRAKLELGVAKGKQDRELHRAMSKRQ